MPYLQPYLVLGLLWLSYGTIHSVLASLTVKRWVERRAKRLFRAYRLLYNISAFGLLLLLIRYQLTIPHFPLFARNIILAFIGGATVVAGLWLVIKALFGYDLHEFIGIPKRRTYRPVASTFKEDGLLRHVRHPLYLGILLVVWGLVLITPWLATLFTAGCVTAYIGIGHWLEEQKLVVEFGDAYRQYQRRVPRLVPTWKTSHRK